MAAATDNADREALLYQINHVFLPPELPQKDDTNAFNEKVLMETVISGLKLFRTYFPMNQTYQLDHSIRMMHCMISMRDKNGFLDPIILDEKMRRLSDFDSIPIHLRNQNSGLLITKVGSEFRFESLELLARDKDVMGCKGRLKRRFPDASVALHDRHIKDGRFRKPFIELLVKLDREQSPKHQTRLETAIYDNTDATSGEEIDTTDPQLVTGMVMAMLWGIGRIIDSLRICKHSREEVLLYDGLLPWRRSPLWLLIRVSLQLTMERLGEIFVANNKPGSLYKDLMAFLMSYILRNATYRGIPHDLLFAMTAKISRRMFKLQLSEEVPWLSYTENATRDVELMLRQTWDSIELTVQNRWDLSALHSLDFDVDTMLSLDSLQPYLEQITLRDHCTENSKIEDTRGHAFQRNEDHRRPIGTFNKDHEFRYFELADFEHSVEYYLESFTATSNEPATSEFPDEESTKLDIPDLESDTLESFLNQCDSKVVENTTMPVFSYGPLQQDEVRVIKIKQGDFDDPIVCDLEHVALSTAPEFHALSYVWGDTSVKFPIQINGHSFQITKNLHTGMRQIRKKYADIGNFNLWIDAICINQGDKDEKSKQVPRMKEIYSSATQVIAWIGTNDDEQDDAVRFIFRLSQRVFNEIGYATEPGLFDKSPWSAVLKNALEEQHLDIGSIIKAADNLSNRPWFSRVWVVQEVVLAAKSPLVLAGDHAVSFEEFCVFLFAWDSTSIKAPDEMRRSIGGANLLYYLRQSRITRHETTPSWGCDSVDLDTFARELHEVLRRTGHHQSTLPQDKIYGVLSLVSIPELPQNLKPDYELEFSDVFHQYAMLLYGRTGDLSFIRGKSRLLGVPSWVPNFSDLLYTGAEPVTEQSDISFSSDSKIMTVKGVQLGEVAAVLQGQDSSHGNPKSIGRSLRILEDTILKPAAEMQKTSLSVLVDHWLYLISLMMPRNGQSGMDRQCYDYCVKAVNVEDDLIPHGLEEMWKLEIVEVGYILVYFEFAIRKDHFLTDNGLFGIWDDVRERDVVSALKGTVLPILLRPCGENHTVVGGCLLSGGLGMYTEEFFSRRNKKNFSLI